MNIHYNPTLNRPHIEKLAIMAPHYEAITGNPLIQRMAQQLATPNPIIAAHTLLHDVEPTLRLHMLRIATHPDNWHLTNPTLNKEHFERLLSLPDTPYNVRTIIHNLLEDPNSSIPANTLFHQTNPIIYHRLLKTIRYSSLSTKYQQATQSNNYPDIQFLIEQKADIFPQNQHLSPLELAVIYNEDLSHFSEIPETLNPDRIDSLHLLQLSVSFENLPTTQRLLESNANINEKDHQQSTPLIRAAVKNNTPIIQLLLDHNANINDQYHLGATPIHIVTVYNNIAALQLLLDSHANINIQTTQGRTPLQIAANNNNLECFQILLDRSANVNTRDNDDCTALHYCATNNQVDLIHRLIDHGAKINAKSKITDNDPKFSFYHGTPLLLAIKFKQTAAIQALLERHANPNIPDNFLLTPLHVSAIAGNGDITRLLIAHNAKVNTGIPSSKHGKTSLYIACEVNHPEVIEVLLEHRADVNIGTHHNISPLHISTIKLFFDTMRTLIEHKADVNARTKNKKSPLSLAISKNSLEAVQILLENGANPNPKISFRHELTIGDEARKSSNIKRNTFSSYCFIKNIKESIKQALSIDKLIFITPLCEALKIRNIDIFKLLLDHGANIESVINHNLRIIHYAIAQEEYTQPDGTTHIINPDENLPWVRLLIERGADINSRDKNHTTALHLASLYGHTEIVRLLLAHGAQIHQNNDGQTPLDMAIKKGHTEIIEILRSINTESTTCTTTTTQSSQ